MIKVLFLLQQLKVSDFRRYYRSVRYYSVKQLSEEEFKEREAKKMYSVIWRFIYFIDELIFMRKSPVFCDDEMHEKHIVPGEQVKTYLITLIDNYFSNISTWFRQTIASDSETVET